MGGMGLMAWGGILVQKSTDERDAAKLPWAIALGVIGFLSLGVAFMASRRNTWLRRIALSELRRRPGKIVDPDTVSALFVEIVPKSNWSQETLPENATDVGFLRIDPEGRQLLFEGEFMRYQIPAGAITKCEQDFYTRLFRISGGSSLVYFHFVVVTASFSPDQTVELPFRLRRNVSLLSDEKARAANYHLYQQIDSLRKNEVPGARH